MRSTIYILSLGFVSLLSACGVKDTTGSGDVQLTKALTCAAAPRMLYAGETYQASFARVVTTASIDKSIDGGDTGSYLDWGSLSAADDTSVVYTAPAYVPETRVIYVVGATGDGASVKCPVYLLSSQAPNPMFYGVPEDGAVVGLPVSVYALGAAPTVFPDVTGLTPTVKAVVRNLNFNFGLSATSLFNGVTTVFSNLALRFKGALIVPAAAKYRFRITAGKLANFTINGASASSTGAAATVDVTFPAGGKYTMVVDSIYATGTFRTQLDWAPMTGPTGMTVGTFTNIPYANYTRE